MSLPLLDSFAFTEGNFFLCTILFLFFAGLGTSIRWRLQNLSIWDDWISTALLNTFSSFFIGFLIASNPASEVITIFGVGLLGSLSTFSTVIMQSGAAIENRKGKTSVFILGSNIILGVLFAYIGLKLA